jgi:hypothetical protein
MTPPAKSKFLSEILGVTLTLKWVGEGDCDLRFEIGEGCGTAYGWGIDLRVERSEDGGI